MKLLVVTVKNFGSYTDLTFDYSNQGLALISGPTGSGKSTLQDIPAWTLYGVTAKDGNVDEVKNWSTPGVTTATLTVEIAGKLLTITRTRGKPSENDLYWTEGDESKLTRGKDLTDTQRLLEDRLGVSKDTYIAAAYFNEFSPVGSFFVAKAKDRRQLLEKLTDLSLPIALAERIPLGKKEVRKAIVTITSELDSGRGRLSQLIRSKKDCEGVAKSWYEDQERTISYLKERQQNFEKEKQLKIEVLRTKSARFEEGKEEKLDSIAVSLSRAKEKLNKNPLPKCVTCKQPNSQVIKLLTDIDSLEGALLTEFDRENPYTSQIESVEAYQVFDTSAIDLQKNTKNPHDTTKYDKEITKTSSELEGLSRKLDANNLKIDNLEHLYTISQRLRAELVDQAVSQIQDETNRLLETHFESEFRVVFTPGESDDINIDINKNGTPCVYKQLSKGQRGLLKLCFSVAIMGALSNNTGVHFDSLFFDEALDGLDGELKLKALNLFTELSLHHTSIFVIEHASEVKHLFNTHFCVSLKNDESQIESI